MQSGVLCRSRRELSHEHFIAKVGFDTAESEPCKVCPLSVYSSPRSLLLLQIPQVQGARCAPVDCLQSNCLPANWTPWATEDESTHGAPQPVGPEYRNLFSTRAENSTFPSPDSFRVSEELDVKLWRAASFYAHPGSATDHVSAAQQALADVRASD